MKAPETGIYPGIEYEEYNEWEAVRHSNLFILEEGTLAHYRYTVDHPEEFDSGAFRTGHAGHTAVLEPSEFSQRYVCKPDTYTNEKGEEKKFNANSKVCKQILETLAASGKTILSTAEYQQALACGAACQKKEMLRLLIDKGVPEVCLVWTDEKTGMKCKARVDLLINNSLILDLKTSAFPVNVRRFGSSAARYGYPSQLAYYWTGLKQITEQEPELPLFAAIEKSMVEKIGPGAVAVYQLGKEDMEVGRCQNEYFLERIQKAEEVGEWPGYPDEEISDLVLPGWYGQALNPAE